MNVFDRMIAITRRFGIAIVICGVGAISAAIWGSRMQMDGWGMATGVAIFAVIYTAIINSRGFAKWVDRPVVRRSLLITYATRIACSLIVPVGMAIDMIPGMLAFSLLHVDKQSGYVGTLAATVLVGVFIHLLMLPFFGLVYVIATPMMNRDVPRQRGFELLPPTHGSSSLRP